MALINVEYIKTYEKFRAIVDEGVELRDCVELDDSVNMYRILDRVTESLSYKMSLIIDFQSLAFEIESEKDKFLVQKIERKHFNELIDGFDRVIKIGRIWKFEDYRCIDWIKRLVELLEKMKEFFEEGHVVADESIVVKEKE